MANRAKTAAQLILHEDLRVVPYPDTLGNQTAGVGYNVAGRGWDFFERVIQRRIDPAQPKLTQAECLAVLAADIERVEKAVIVHWPAYLQLDEVRQRVVIELAFNLGMRANAFVQTKDAIERKDWSRAVRELFKSKWAYQVDDGPGGKYGRADRLGQMLLTGRDYVS